jgi:hypothetical protein
MYNIFVIIYDNMLYYILNMAYLYINFIHALVCCEHYKTYPNSNHFARMEETWAGNIKLVLPSCPGNHSKPTRKTSKKNTNSICSETNNSYKISGKFAKSRADYLGMHEERRHCSTYLGKKQSTLFKAGVHSEV